MYYFVPAWYQEKFSLPWQYISKEVEFDDTINQVRMFKQQNLDTELIILNYMPNLASFLHRQQIFDVSSWSLFDEIQGIQQNQEKQWQPFNYKELNWPSDVAFITTPFITVAMIQHEIYAKIYFNEAGGVLWIEQFNSNQLNQKFVIDDRGFVSCVQIYQEGKHIKTTYMNMSSEIQMIHWIENDSYEIVQSAEIYHKLNQHTFTSLDLLTETILQLKMVEMNHIDTLVIATDEHHNKYFLNSEMPVKKVFSFFSERNKNDSLVEISNSKDIDLIVVDSDSHFTQLDTANIQVPMTIISPYDSRLNLGASQEIKENYIWVNIDNINRELVDTLSELMSKEIRRNPDIRVLFASYTGQTEKNVEIEHLAQKLNDSLTPEKTFEEKINQLNTEEEEIDFFTFSLVREELDIISAFSKVRLIIDLGETPHLYTQIAGISAGIPQINRLETAYVKHLENGYILNSVNDITIAIRYYLDTLKNWNIALVSAIEKIVENNSGELVNKWQKYLERR